MAKKKAASKGKKEVKNKKPSNKYKAYKISGDKAERVMKSCPKCGPGVFMGEHKDRHHCGSCQYTEFKK